MLPSQVLAAAGDAGADEEIGKQMRAEDEAADDDERGPGGDAAKDPASENGGVGEDQGEREGDGDGGDPKKHGEIPVQGKTQDHAGESGHQATGDDGGLDLFRRAQGIAREAVEKEQGIAHRTGDPDPEHEKKIERDEHDAAGEIARDLDAEIETENHRPARPAIQPGHGEGVFQIGAVERRAGAEAGEQALARIIEIGVEPQGLAEVHLGLAMHPRAGAQTSRHWHA